MARSQILAASFGSLLLGMVAGAGIHAAWAAPLSATGSASRAKAGAAPADYSRFEKLDIFARALAHIEQHYVRPVDDKTLIYAALDGLTNELDPHTSFLRPVDAQMLREDMDGRFGGVGLVVNLARAIEADQVEAEADTKADNKADTKADNKADNKADADKSAQAQSAEGEIVMRVADVIPGGPADKAGIREGDEITRIEGKAVAHYADLRDAIAVMRGPAGSQVSFSFRHVGEQAQEVSVTRAVVKAPAVEVTYLGDGFGVLRLREFQESSSRDMRKGLRELKAASKAGGEDKFRGVVLDLRDNGGGLLGQAIAVADLFLKSGVIVRTRGRAGRLMEEARATPAGTFGQVPLVVLINKGTASASEIVAGALQDHRRAIVVGERSYGKGSVQSPFRLGDGSILKLTIALFYTPHDRLIQASGINPDIRVGVGPALFAEAHPDLEPERANPKHLRPEDFGHEVSAAMAEDEDAEAAVPAVLREAGDDPQLARALQHLIALDRLSSEGRSAPP